MIQTHSSPYKDRDFSQDYSILNLFWPVHPPTFWIIITMIKTNMLTIILRIHKIKRESSSSMVWFFINFANVKQTIITMESSLYSYSLFFALPLMLFFGFYFLFARTPEKKIFKNYLRSRRIMGIALLLLAANYSVHFFFGIRFKNVNAAILMNLSTYFLCYYLFSSAMITLLDRFYITRKRSWTHIILWVIFSSLSGVVLLLLPGGAVQNVALLALAAWLVIYGLVLARRVIVAYRRAVRIFDDTHADDIGAYIEWLSIFTYWALIFGVGCGLLKFLQEKYVFIFILSYIPLYSYIF